MIFEQVRVGGDRNFAYIVGDEQSKEAAAVDPSCNPELVLTKIKDYGLTLTYVINTHGHYDHTGGNSYMLQHTDAKLAAYGAGRTGIDVKDGDVLKLGALDLAIIHAPGHTADGICILADGKLMTGDTLFVGKVGGTGFGKDARAEYDALHRKLLTLPGETEVWPGHDYGVAPTSTIDHEKKTNPFLLCTSFDAFVDLKKNWAEYKRVHGIT